ncbi:cupin domain-containing protein [Deinococcus malanensis]|uniref:cupin domain-containing protein n=1 Tax=Deinococcus malanensis TaxID=1706855 RepID=UPI00362A7144
MADELMTFKATAEQTGGLYALTDSVVPPGGGSPPHIHHREDEAFRVLEGRLDIRVGEQRFTVEVGSFVHLPRDVIHSHIDVGTEPARFLTWIVPAGLERFFKEVGTPGTDVSSPPPFDEDAINRLLGLPRVRDRSPDSPGR